MRKRKAKREAKREAKPKANLKGRVRVLVRALNTVAQSSTLINDVIKSIFRRIHKGVECTKRQATKYVNDLFSGKQEATRIYFLTDEAGKVLAYAVVEQHIIPANDSPCYYLMYLDSFESGKNYAGRLLGYLPGILRRRTVVHKDAQLCEVDKITTKNSVFFDARSGLVDLYRKYGCELIVEKGISATMVLIP